MARQKLAPTDKRGGAGAGIKPAHGGGIIGNAKHLWSQAIANKVEIMAAQGLNKEGIAYACDISYETLTKYYNEQVEHGQRRVNSRVFAAILSTAEGERVPCIECEDHPGTTAEGKLCKTCHGTAFIWRREPNTTAQVWYSKNRMGWTDKERIEHVGDGGGPVIAEMRSSADTVKDRLAAIKKRLLTAPKAEDEATSEGD